MLLAMLIAGVAMPDGPDYERMMLCKAYHETWQWDEHNAGRKVPEDSDWLVPFNHRLYAAGEAQGIPKAQSIRSYNALVRTMQKGLTAEQRADWQKCIGEVDWKADDSGKFIWQ